MFSAHIAAKEKLKVMIGLSGPSGSGKTYSALQLAFGIAGDWGKIALADTENKSALYYAGKPTGIWLHIPFDETARGGYSPQNWIKLITYAESLPIDVLILDSVSAEWEGVGGCLDLIESLGKGKNAFAGWKTVTPMHRAFIDRMRHSRLHIIATMRSKQDYVVESNEHGKQVPKKVGTKSIQREGTDYEFGIILDIDMSHFATSSKDRTGLFAERHPFKIDEDTGKELLAWANAGVDSEPPKPAAGFDPTNDDHIRGMNILLDNNHIDNRDYRAFIIKEMAGHQREYLNVLLEKLNISNKADA